MLEKSFSSVFVLGGLAWRQ